MASKQEVKEYLAYWFQLGKKVMVSNLNKAIAPSEIFQGGKYSPEFETCWQEIITSNPEDIYLEGTNETIQELLSSKWDIVDCARCEMPVPMVSIGTASVSCPCSDLDNWPNQELPKPRSPINSQTQLNKLNQRLLTKDKDYNN